MESLRAWLGGVLRNRARQQAREDRNRLAREQVSARPEGLPSPDELLERMGAHGALVEEMTALGEPYRSMLILRFFEGLTQAEIAEQEGCPVASVSSRLTRALAQLRERLDRRYDGGRTAWLSALAPLWRAKPAPLPIVPLLGALTMSKVTVVAVGARISVEEERLKLDEPVFSDGEGRFLLPGETFDLSLHLHAELAGHTELLYGLHHRDALEATIVLAPSLAVAGQVVDAEGVGVAGATVYFSAGEAWRAQLDEAIQSSVSLFLKASCDGQGRFTFDRLPRAVGSGFYAEQDGQFSERVACPDGDTESLLIELFERERSGAQVLGRVLDPAGVGAAHTWISCGTVATRTDENGAFALPRQELAPGLPMRAAKQGWLPVELPAPVTAAAQGAGWPEQVLMRKPLPPWSEGVTSVRVD
ncbi:MAG: hypothetical protein ACI9HE_000747 [Planctomycetota bacterium]